MGLIEAICVGVAVLSGCIIQMFWRHISLILPRLYVTSLRVSYLGGSTWLRDVRPLYIYLGAVGSTREADGRVLVSL